MYKPVLSLHRITASFVLVDFGLVSFPGTGDLMSIYITCTNIHEKKTEI